METNYILPYISYNTFYYFFSALSQSLAALVALVGVFHVYRFPKLIPQCQHIVGVMKDNFEFGINYHNGKSGQMKEILNTGFHDLKELDKALAFEVNPSILLKFNKFHQSKKEFDKELKEDKISDLLKIKEGETSYESGNHLRIIISLWPKLDHNINLLSILPIKAKKTIRLLLISLILSLLILFFNGFLRSSQSVFYIIIFISLSLSLISCYKMYQYIKDSL